MIMLRADRLSKTFVLHLQGAAKISVLQNASLEMRAGECVALRGPSGAGKSTLMRSLYGTYLVDDGEILVWHRNKWVDVASRNARSIIEVRHETMGYVSQFLRVVPRVSALEIVAEAGLARLRIAEQARSEARALLLRLNIPARLHTLPPATFSGGEQQRINLARGFIGQHPILLLDEPTAALDRENRDVVISMIRDAKANGVALAGIFHDHEVSDAVADRVCNVSPLKQAA